MNSFNRPIKAYGLIILFLVVASCNLAPGSYPFAETYTLHHREAKVIESVERFRKKNTQFDVPPKVTWPGSGPDGAELSDGWDSHWYHIYFYNSEKDQIIHAWVRGNARKEYTTFALVGVNQGLTLGNWKEINEDFTDDENEMHKKWVEERILNEIERELGE